MKQKLMRMLKNTRIVIMLVCVFLAFLMLSPQPFNKGAMVRSVVRNSSAEMSGFESPKPNAPAMTKERIIRMNSYEIRDLDDYYRFIETLKPNMTVLIRTNKKSEPYRLMVRPKIKTIELNYTLNRTIAEQTEINETVNGTTVTKLVNVTRVIEVTATQDIVIGPEDIGLRVDSAPTTNIRKGLDLQGGTRVVLKSEEPLSRQDIDTVIAGMSERLNVYGLSDVIVRAAGDLYGNQYIIVEIAGANEEEVKELMARQGKFEAKIRNTSVFKGGSDITYVCRTADCSGIDPHVGCGKTSDNSYVCRFYFQITLSSDAAQRQADATKDLAVVSGQGRESYLSDPLDLYLDDKLVDQLNIVADLRGQAATDISISGSGSGISQATALEDSLKSMKRLQTILITGSLPVKLNVVKTDNISPMLGREFMRNTLKIGVFCVLAVALVILIKYRKPVVVLPILLVNWLEIYFLLAIAALINWNIDIASVAGIIITIGTGVNDQIIITDETLRGEVESYNWKQKLKKAFFIVFAAYFATTGSMIPLLFAGAGLLKGFALTTIIGISVGVFITRPAYAEIIRILVQK